MSPSYSASTRSSLSRIVIPNSLLPITLEAKLLPTTITFVVNPQSVHSPQTGHSWYIEADHEMKNMSLFSLIPKKSDNQYVAHYEVESRRPRFLVDFQFMDAWLTTNHKVYSTNNIEIHQSQTFFYPERADDKMYFQGDPKHRIEILVPGRFIEDREGWAIVKEMFPDQPHIQELLQYQL